MLKGDKVKRGDYLWRVLSIECDKALLITDCVINKILYNPNEIAITWENCTLRRYLNNEFYQALPMEFRNKIVEVTNVNRSEPTTGNPGGNDTRDKVFLLSIDEAKRYFTNDNDRIAYDLQGTISSWWLRSPGRRGGEANIVYRNGDPDQADYPVNAGLNELRSFARRAGNVNSRDVIEAMSYMMQKDAVESMINYPYIYNPDVLFYSLGSGLRPAIWVAV